MAIKHICAWMSVKFLYNTFVDQLYKFTNIIYRIYTCSGEYRIRQMWWTVKFNGFKINFFLLFFKVTTLKIKLAVPPHVFKQRSRIMPSFVTLVNGYTVAYFTWFLAKQKWVHLIAITQPGKMHNIFLFKSFSFNLKFKISWTVWFK